MQAHAAQLFLCFNLFGNFSWQIRRTHATSNDADRCKDAVLVLKSLICSNLIWLKSSTCITHRLVCHTIQHTMQSGTQSFNSMLSALLHSPQSYAEDKNLLLFALAASVIVAVRSSLPFFPVFFYLSYVWKLLYYIYCEDIKVWPFIKITTWKFSLVKRISYYLLNGIGITIIVLISSVYGFY